MVSQLSPSRERLQDRDSGQHESSPVTYSEFDQTRDQGCRAGRIGEDHGLNASMLATLQARVADLESRRGTSGESLRQKGLILTEEAFEVIKALRKLSGIATDVTSHSLLADELADVLFVSAAMANRLPTSLGSSWDIEHARRQGDADIESRPDDMLMASLALAREVLAVVSKLASATLERDAGLSADETEFFADNLENLLVSINDVAALAQINLQAALDQKLHRDQLRLWA